MIRLVLCLVLTFSSLQGTEIKNLERKNLVPWCIVPFDAKKRTPEERAKMLVRFIILPASLHAVDPVLIDRLGKGN